MAFFEQIILKEHTTEHSYRFHLAKTALSDRILQGSLLISSSGFSSGGLLLVILLLLGLVELPLFLTLDGNRERSVVVASTVVADTGVPPELVGEETTQ